MEKTAIDLGVRTERRFIVPQLDTFIDGISTFLERKNFSDDEYVQTIYLNNEEHVVPFGTSIKVRKYFSAHSTPILTEADDYLLELKRGRGFEKEKVRFKGTLDEIIQLANEKYSFPVPLKPYVVSAYRRFHYAPAQHDRLRVTADDNIQYFFFEDGQKESVKIGEENYPRIEVKTRNGEKSDRVNSILRDLNAFSIVSKKATAYFFLSRYIARKGGGRLYNELENCEIESKLLSESEDILYQIRQLFINNKPENFEISKYPYIRENASINRYYKTNGSLLKILLKGNRARVVKKGATTHIGKEHGLDCILKREELKNTISIWSSEMPTAPVAGQLHRARKSFWVGNSETRRMYHISVDRCQSTGRILHQIEVEYTGREFESSEADETAIVKDIANLTDILIRNFPTLRRTTLTKPEWLGL